jgi:2-haloacid dehalogenase
VHEGIRALTFDCYGTLVDWEGGLGSFLYEMQRRYGDREQEPEPGQALRERWEQLQFKRIEGPYRSYREVLADSLSEWVGERGWRWNAHDGEALADAMGSWQPFPDTVPALRLAKEAGLRLWIVSNTDRSIMEHTLRQLQLEFDGVTVAQDCRAYKPGREPFDRALAELGERPQDVLHVAFGFKYDIATAHALGMRTAWVNRRGETLGEVAPDGPEPDHEWRSLWDLAAWARS